MMNSTPAPEASRRLDPDDPVLRRLASAVAQVRLAAEEVAGDEVGEHVGVQLEDEAAVTHLFDARKPGYRGWRWAVTVACAGPDTEVTVSEVVLLPGPDALVAPEWVPWQHRVKAGDLGVGDLMPTAPDDPRLVPGYVQSEDPAIEEAAMEVGFGRARVMSRSARLDAAARWKAGEFGPRSDMARGAPGHCATCGFYLPLAGSLRAAYGVCGNEIAPADGHIVHAEYGCGAHSEAEVEQISPVLVADLIYDDNALLDIEPIDRPQPTPELSLSDPTAPPQPRDLTEPPPAAEAPTEPEPQAPTQPGATAELEPSPPPAAPEPPAEAQPEASVQTEAPAEPEVAEPQGFTESPALTEPEPSAGVEPEASVEPEVAEPQAFTESPASTEPKPSTEPEAAADIEAPTEPDVAEPQAFTESPAPAEPEPSAEVEPPAEPEPEPEPEPEASAETEAPVAPDVPQPQGFIESPAPTEPSEPEPEASVESETPAEVDVVEPQAFTDPSALTGLEPVAEVEPEVAQAQAFTESPPPGGSPGEVEAPAQPGASGEVEPEAAQPQVVAEPPLGSGSEPSADMEGDAEPGASVEVAPRISAEPEDSEPVEPSGTRSHAPSVGPEPSADAESEGLAQRWALAQPWEFGASVEAQEPARPQLFADEQQAGEPEAGEPGSASTE